MSLNAVSFHCSACGACCNSAPKLSLPELFHHERRFIGCLAIHRFQPFEAFATELFEPVQGPTGPELVLLATQAFDDPTRGRCPALGADQTCTVHRDRKPKNCQAVPLEALLPDSMQHAILATRAQEAAYLGASCIELGRRDGHLPLVQDRRVIDGGALEALGSRRRELLDDRRFWGQAVFALLRFQLFDHPERIGELPLDGFFSMSLAPALAVIASASQRCRVRTLVYLNAQIELMAETLDGMVKSEPDASRELSGLLRANLALRSSLQRPHGSDGPNPEAAAVEAWLGVGASS